MRKILTALLIGLASANLQAQLVVKLSSQTLAAFEANAAKVEAGLDARAHGSGSFLRVEESPEELAHCMSGQLVIKSLGPDGPVSVPQGLIHDWDGAVFIPHAGLQGVLAILENFDNHHKIYPEVAASKTIERNAHEVTGFWRLEQKGFVPVILNVEQTVHYEKVADGKWIGHSYARKIVETDTAPFARGRKFPQDEGHGYLWRLYSYWSLEAVNGGVLAECRTLSLSRDIPAGLAWAVGPYVQKTPENSLRSTLQNTRQAATR